MILYFQLTDYSNKTITTVTEVSRETWEHYMKEEIVKNSVNWVRIRDEVRAS